jgi:hypothetical protein
MAVSLTSTGITFSDGTSQSSKAQTTSINGSTGVLSYPVLGAADVVAGTAAVSSLPGTRSVYNGNSSWTSLGSGTFASAGTATMYLALGVPAGNYSYCRGRMLVSGSVAGSQINSPSRGSGSGSTTITFSVGNSWELQGSSSNYNHPWRITTAQLKTDACLKSSASTSCTFN